MKILSIEDDAGICALIKSVLTAAKLTGDGFDFRCIHTLDAGLAEVQVFTPDIILLDLKLPREDGTYLDAEETIACIPTLSEIAPVIVLSGYSEQYFLKSIEAGASDCLSKSIYLNARQESIFAHQLVLAITHWRKTHGAKTH